MVSLSLAIIGVNAPIRVNDRADDESRIISLQIPDGTALREPIRLHFDHQKNEAATRVRIVVGKRARAIVFEELRSSTDAPWSHAVEVILDEEASLECVSLQAAQPMQRLILQQSSRVGEGASISWRNATLGGGTVKHDLRSNVLGENAASSIDWIFYASDDECYELSARNVFEGRNGSGEITMKGVAEENGHVNAKGMIEIGNSGGGTETYLTQNVLMLDKTAKVDAIPHLEIKTNDVKASHSASIARVTEEDLFYFATRGIDRREARGMFVMGFLGDLAGKIGDTPAREKVLEAIRAKFVKS
ncbi:SufD family Fe-S cluster assembly protein [Candidatus Peregrinibacteria bacterium]|nr:SufD family Fe-S cluster assembly protein [Candidatus Peregrinibacteria bacterium]MBI3816545.1 SufD family Fe-S cluster assembly protein [Candidatus Peregrinibacteria bacterium]